MAMLMRLGLLLVLAWIIGLTAPLFTVLGEEIATVYSGVKEAGGHRVSWDASGRPAGLE